MAILVPAWDESAVIAPMLRSTLNRLDYDNYRIFVGHYRNDPATAAAIAGVSDDAGHRGPGRSRRPDTKADCLNHLYDALIAFELRSGAARRPSSFTTRRTSSTASSFGFSTA